MEPLKELIDDAKREYALNEMEDPFLLDGTSEMHARNALSYILNGQWDEALNEAQVAAKQRSRWEDFLRIVTRIHGATKSSP